MWVSQFAVLCDSNTTLCAISEHHLHTTLTLLVVLRPSLGQCRHARMPCAGQLQLRCGHVLGDCFDHASSQPILFSETTIETVRKQSGLHATVLSRSLHRVWIPRLPTASDRFKVVTTPISLTEFTSFCHTFFGIVKDCQDLRLPGIVISKLRLQHLSPR